MSPGISNPNTLKDIIRNTNASLGFWVRKGSVDPILTHISPRPLKHTYGLERPESSLSLIRVSLF